MFIPKSKTPRSSVLAVGIASLLVAHSAFAVDRFKQDNTDALNLPTSWDTPPGSGDVAVWDSTVTAPNTTLLGADLSWSGIRIANPGGLVTISAGNTLTLGGAGIDMSAATQNLTLSNAVTLGVNQDWNVGTGRTLTAGGAIGGSGALNKTGAGTLTLSVANNFSGGTTISAGTINLGNASGFGTGTLTLSGGTINMNGLGVSNAVNVTANTTTNVYFTSSSASGGLGGTITGSGTILNNDPTSTRNFFITGDISNFTGTIDLENGGDNPTLGNGSGGGVSFDGSKAKFVINCGKPLNFGGTTGTYKMGELTGNGLIQPYNTHGIEIGALGTTTAFSGTIANQGGANISLTKVGAGTLTLSNANGNSYNAGTTVSEGTLLVTNTTNSGIGAGAVTVGSNATLGGTGKIVPGGANNLSINGILAPGSGGIGNLTIDLGSTTGKVTLSGTGTFKFELGTAGAAIGTVGTGDLITLAGASANDFNLAGGGNTIDFNGGGQLGWYKLIDTSLDTTTWTGITFDSTTGLISSGLIASNLASGLTGNLVMGTATNGGSVGDIYLQAVPEPGSFTALLGGCGVLLGLRRRRTA